LALVWASILLNACDATSPTGLGCSGPYPEQSSSPYTLPWPSGMAFRVSQGNCGPTTHAAGELEYAYDFEMPVGTLVRAARDGVVLLVEDAYLEGNRTRGHENYVVVRHEDDTLASYAHLTSNGVLVSVGQQVGRGQAIGLSGGTGTRDPHLHFHVQQPGGSRTTPVTFRNTRAHARGLREGEVYRANPE
jgi:murein DD-endopeptidase MepM/ murein hydrolase activator NlpD